MGLYKPSVSNTLKKIQKKSLVTVSQLSRILHDVTPFSAFGSCVSASFWVAVARKPQRTSAAFCTSLRPPGTTKLLRKGSEARPASEMEVVCPMIYHIYLYIYICYYHPMIMTSGDYDNPI